MTTLTELREALDHIKEQSGSGSKQRKQQKFQEIYTPNVGHLVCGELYDDAGVGPSTAREAAEAAFGEVPDAPTLSEALTQVDATPVETDVPCIDLRLDLDALAEESGDDQTEFLVEILESYPTPSIVTLALLDDESIGLGTSQMREIWFDGSRSERKRCEALTEGTVDFINRAKNDFLPDEPQPMEPFDPMLAHRESRGEPDNAVAQPKIDGYRLLVHVTAGEAVAYTRNRKDVTGSLPELNEIDWPEGDYIFDCEVIAEDGSYSSTSSRVGTKPSNVERDVEMHFAMFDLVFANSDMTRKSYRQRYKQLEKIVTQAISDSRVYFLEASSNIDAVKQEARERGYEGIILKNLESEYALGERSDDWVKSKHKAETVDVVATKFIEGDGRASGTLGKVVLESADGHPVGKTGSGFTDTQRHEIWDHRDYYRNQVMEVEGEAFADAIRFPIFQRWRIDDGEADDYDEIAEILPDP